MFAKTMLRAAGAAGTILAAQPVSSIRCRATANSNRPSVLQKRNAELEQEVSTKKHSDACRWG
jgi:hypothetical protein